MGTDVLKLNPKDRILDSWVAEKMVGMATSSSGSSETRKALLRELETTAREFAGVAPSPIERSLAESAALAYFALRYAEAQLASGLADGDLGPKQEERMERRIAHAHRRYVSVLRSLATVRKLALPSVQVNIESHHTNMIAGVEPTGR